MAKKKKEITIRSIRTSERRIWQQITNIFAESSIDYDKDSEITHNFYQLNRNSPEERIEEYTMYYNCYNINKYK